MSVSFFNSSQSDPEMNGDAPYNYEDCVEALEQHQEAFDRAADAFSGWYDNNNPGIGTVIGEGAKAWNTYQIKEEICDFGEEEQSSFNSWYSSDDMNAED